MAGSSGRTVGRVHTGQTGRPAVVRVDSAPEEGKHEALQHASEIPGALIPMRGGHGGSRAGKGRGLRVAGHRSSMAASSCLLAGAECLLLAAHGRQVDVTGLW